MANNRDIRFDLVKLLTIYLVILGHVFPILNPEFGYGHVVRKIIYTFHMPLFMMISGYFCTRSLSYPFLLLVKKKLKQLVLPAITCTVLVCIAAFILFDDYSYRDEIIGNSWYLKTLFVVYIIAWPMRHLSLADGFYAVISILLLFCVPHAYSLQINYLYPFFMIGYFMNKYDILGKIEEGGLVRNVAFVLFVCYCMCMLLYDGDYIPITYKSILSNPAQLVLKFLMAFSGSLIVILFICQLCSCNKFSFIGELSKYGRYTLGIYVLQSFFVDFLLKKICPLFINDVITYYVSSIVISIIILFLCILLIKLFSRNIIIDYIFFGGQYYKK